MAHIVEFTVENLAGRKGIYSQTLDRNLNVFFGFNGSGKTSLLKILHSAMNDSPATLENVPFKSAEVKIYSIDYDRVFTYTIQKKSKKRTVSSKSEFQQKDAVLTDSQEFLDVPHPTAVPPAHKATGWTVRPSPPENITRWRHRYLPTARLYLGTRTAIDLADTDGLSEDALDMYFAKSLQTLWRNYYADIVTAVSAAQQDGIASILKAALSGKKRSKKLGAQLDIKTAYDRMASFLTRQGSRGILGSFEDFQKQFNEDQQFQSLALDMNETEKRIDIALAPRRKFETLVQNMFTGNKTVKFDTRSIDVMTDDEENISLSTLSSGEKHVLKILIETLLAKNSTIIIDEPEISIHIDWQRELTSTMLQLTPNAQLIIATHSPEIMAGVNDERIFRL